MTREVGRQPWIVYGMMRTSEGVSNLPADAVLWSFVMYMLFYGVIGVAALVFMVRTIRKGPSFDAPPHTPSQHGQRAPSATAQPPKPVPFAPPAPAHARIATRTGE